jgi:hypothetical protein
MVRGSSTSPTRSPPARLALLWRSLGRLDEAATSAAAASSFRQAVFVAAALMIHGPLPGSDLQPAPLRGDGPRLRAGGPRVPREHAPRGPVRACLEFGDQGDFDLPDRWLARKEFLDLETPLNFVCTVDSTGGSSGSPVFDGERRIVGVLFDGNEESTENVYVFEDRTARAIAVHSRAMLETLRNVYEASALAAELEGRSD